MAITADEARILCSTTEETRALEIKKEWVSREIKSAALRQHYTVLINTSIYVGGKDLNLKEKLRQWLEDDLGFECWTKTEDTMEVSWA